ncbi:hypothetical protein BCR33DRAFT_716853 [Rhizoclosmatium globosum]|uniref:DUF3533 domain-containing protein n=1 Tax=Rhizoclosmatium globosum TaxID=329046 RepID=A0A1Y2CDQ3_9FUNG|nr:hypothetical protein BCR33DRAFT_716853 [Rhizoclosmatium globosum]|eukprot:ORY44944.1 hypothetical protein BCR33DRAFT_716853 [Rhizoclosmatium globosum]
MRITRIFSVAVCVATFAVAVPFAGKRQHEVAATTAGSADAHGATAPVATISGAVSETHSNSTTSTGSGEVAPHAVATGAVEGHGSNSTSSGEPSTSGEGEGAASAEGEEEEPPLTQKQIDRINKNGVNAIYVIVSLVAVMAGCMFFSATSDSANDDQEASLALTDIDNDVLYAHGGVPQYNADGTLKAIHEYKWKPQRSTIDGPIQNVLVLETKEQQRAEKEFQSAMEHVKENRDYTKNR